MERVGLPRAQPPLAWTLVLVTSLIEIYLLRERLRGVPSSIILTGIGALLLVFDYTTTALGLMFSPWTADLHWLLWVIWALLAIALAIPLTFGFEEIVARLWRCIRWLIPTRT